MPQDDRITLPGDARIGDKEGKAYSKINKVEIHTRPSSLTLWRPLIILDFNQKNNTNKWERLPLVCFTAVTFVGNNAL